MANSEFKSQYAADAKLEQYKEKLRAQQDAPQEVENPLTEAQQEIAQLQTALKEAKSDSENDRLRALADLENTRRRLQKEREDLLKYGNESLLRELLTTLDNLERTLPYLSPDTVDRNLYDGITLVFKQLLSTLQRFGIQEISSQSQPFDPHVHEAVAQQETEGVPANTVVETHQKGYRYHDRLLRPARVTIST